jgi:post-segregation antitoxin (ccd killing protein)
MTDEKKEKRVKISTTLDSKLNEERKRYGIKLSKALELGLKSILGALEEKAEPEEVVTRKSRALDERKQLEFGRKWESTIESMAELYERSGTECENPFVEDIDFKNYVSRQALEIGIPFATLEYYTLEYVAGKVNSRMLKRMKKENIIEMGNELEEVEKE